MQIDLMRLDFFNCLTAQAPYYFSLCGCVFLARFL